MGWNVTDPPSPPGWPVSALIGKPPACEQDYYTIWYFLSFMHGLHPGVDPSLGLPKRKPSSNSSSTAPPVLVHENQGPGIIAGHVVVGVFLLFLVSLRLWLRYHVKRLVWGWDDWLMIPALLGVEAQIVKTVLEVKWGGLGKHSYDVTYREFARLNELAGPPGYMLFFLSAALIKLSLTFSLYRLVFSRSKAWENFSIVLMVLLALWGLAGTFMPWFSEGDPRTNVDTVFAGRWVAQHQTAIPVRYGVGVWNRSMTIIHITFDFILFFAAIFIFWQLKVGIGRKVRLMVLFSSGLASCVCSVYRLAAAHKAPKDIFWEGAPIFTWSIIDLGTALVVTNLPVLSVLFGKSSKNSYASSGSDRELQKNYSPPQPRPMDKDLALIEDIEEPLPYKPTT